jgi:hypothetical protein
MSNLFLMTVLTAALWPLLFVWILSAIATALISADRGRGGVIGFAGGAILGPFAVLLALLTPVNVDGQERRMIASGRYCRCPDCAELARADGRICGRCRAELPPTEEIPARVPLVRLSRTEANGIAVELRRP